MQFCQRIPLTINHDWTNTKTVMEKLLKLKDNADVSEYGYSDHYDLKTLGCISVHKLSTSWFRLAGPAINRTMPWLDSMLEMMQELQPDDGCISYLDGNGGEHVDLPKMKTALNYIFDNTDDLAYTRVNNNNIIEQYSSELNTAWLLNAQVPHSIVNQGKRWTLSIHFDCEYNTVLDWFNRHPDLIFGSKENK